MRVWIIALLTLLAALAGCTDSGDADDDTTGDDIGDQDDPMDDGSDAANATSDADNAGDDQENEPAQNTPPTATLSANVTSGEVPFNVLFEFNGSDPDGDDLTWALDADGDGAADAEGSVLPSNFTTTFDSEGIFNVSLTVSDGSNTTEATLQVTALAAAGGGAGNTTAFETIYVELEIIEGCELCIDSELVPGVGQLGAAGCVGWNLGVNELDCSWLELPPEAAGQIYSVDGARTNIPDNPVTGSPDEMDPDVEFLTACESGAESLGIVRNSGPEEGIVPEGAGCMVIMEFFWPNLGAIHFVSVGESLL